MKRKPILVGAVAILAIVIAVGVWYFYTQPTQPLEEAASIENMVYPLPDRPSYAVLPFVNVSKNPELEYLCDGITETIITTLSKNPYIFVIASNSSFTYKGKPVKVNKVAEELGVQYVIEGSIQKSGDLLRITAQLVDALTGRHIWSERFDRSLKDLFKLQDEIVLEILQSTQISDTMIGISKDWRFRGGTNSVDAQLKFFEAMFNYRHRTENHVIKAKQLFEEAIAIDPNFALPHAMLSFAYQFLGRYYSSGEASRTNLKKGLELAEKAIELDNSLSTGHETLGYYYGSQKKYDTAIAEYKKAIELAPENPFAHTALGQCLLWIYRLEESLYHRKEAIRLSPLEPVNYLDAGRTYFHLRQYEDAIKMHKKVFELMQKSPMPAWWAHLHIAMVYSEIGRDEEARTHMKKLLEFYPKFNLEGRRRQLFFKDPANTEREIEALRKAGAPEHPPSQ
jgi:adenylate cyclase